MKFHFSGTAVMEASGAENNGLSLHNLAFFGMAWKQKKQVRLSEKVHCQTRIL